MQRKAGTPTMGGLLVRTGFGVIVGSLVARAIPRLASGGARFHLAFIGHRRFDDWRSLTPPQPNTGLSPRGNCLLRPLLPRLFLLVAAWNDWISRKCGLAFSPRPFCRSAC